MSRFLRFVLVGSLGWLVISNDSVHCWADGSGSSKERVEEFFEAMESLSGVWDDYDVHIGTVERMHRRRRDGTETDEQRNHEMARRGSMRLIKNFDGENNAERIMARNTEYYFSLEKSGDAYVITDLGPLTAGAIKMVDTAFEENGGMYYLLMTSYIDGPWREFVKRPGFQVLDISDDPRPGFVRVEYTPPADFMPGFTVKGLYSIFDTSHGWIVRETGYDLHSNSGKRPGYYESFRYVIERVEEVRGVPASLQYIASTIGSDNLYEKNAGIESRLISENPPAEMFYLSFYGLPEPEFIPPRPRLRYLSLSILFLVLAAAWYLGSRQETPKSTKIGGSHEETPPGKQ